MKKITILVLSITALLVTACGPSAGQLRMEAMEAEHERQMAEIEDERFESEMRAAAIQLAHESGLSVALMLAVNDIAPRCNYSERCVEKIYSACATRAGGDKTTEQQNAIARCMTSSVK